MTLRIFVPAALLCLAIVVRTQAQQDTPELRKVAPGGEEGVQVRMGEVEIQGEVERPGVFYIIPRREVRMDVGALTKDFRAEIMEPLLPGPFVRWVDSQGIR